MLKRIKRLLGTKRKSLPIAVPHVTKEVESLLPTGELARIAALPRRKQDKTQLFDQPMHFPDGYWFIHSLNELFAEEVYRFEPSAPDPLIVDCGANIGLSIIYFKRLSPAARIIAFEPDEEIFGTLKKNLAPFRFSGIELHQKAVWNATTQLRFFSEGTLGGRVVDGKKSSDQKIIKVEATRLRDLLNQAVEFLKLDIEGAEYEVLKDCADVLGNVKNLFIEYHSNAKQDQKLDEILRVASNAGFRYYIKEASVNIRYPFTEFKKNGFDLQLNIFCYRPQPTKS